MTKIMENSQLTQQEAYQSNEGVILSIVPMFDDFEQEAEELLKFYDSAPQDFKRYQALKAIQRLLHELALKDFTINQK